MADVREAHSKTPLEQSSPALPTERAVESTSLPTFAALSHLQASVPPSAPQRCCPASGARTPTTSAAWGSQELRHADQGCPPGAISLPLWALLGTPQSDAGACPPRVFKRAPAPTRPH
ncbi:hypothetical protein NDU88_003991 [Pleurodeles waltl]|uniref:Uncharacterized protein n=1 Tax=Pleurodeles waltl TaxID=8319 RepID=A0AAV7WSS1_PLEWA|nr:hypothetical protein NDU88_003991 [Pleurodeles waltl]